jgi:Xanthine dehydrogenase, iron-sulfur cluster and FAD-binding subunit A
MLTDVVTRFSGERCFQSLSDFLRHDLRLVGTKVVCAEGDCGSCTVIVGRIRNGKLKYEGLDSCIQYLYQLDCTHVISVEGLKYGNQIHPVQQAMVDAMGSQCGYCTPGFVMSIAAMLEIREDLTRLSIQDGLTGNLCRCTGYEQIIEAALSLQKLSKGSSGLQPPSKRFDQKLMIEDFSKHDSEPLLCENVQKWNGVTNRLRFFVPCEMKEAIEFKQRHRNVTVVAGGTDISVQINKQYIEPKCVMSLTNLKKLDFIEVKNKKVKVGASVTWTKLAEFCHQNLQELSEIISLFASRQRRNAGTLAGNIANASPIC